MYSTIVNLRTEVVRNLEYGAMQYAIIFMECVIMLGMSRGLRNVQLFENVKFINIFNDIKIM